MDVHEEFRRLEWEFIDGLWAPYIANWFETVTLSGIPKTPSLEVVNGYTIEFTGSNYNVILTDYDNNLVDVYVPSNGISILGNNSVGRQTIEAGVVTSQDIIDITDSVWANVVETLTAEEILRVLLAVASGKTTITDLGGGSATVKFRDLADTKDRVSADMDENERTSVTIDES